MKTNYSYNAITNTLTVSAAFLKNAANLHSKEYEIIRTLRADHGEITIVTEERRKSVSRAMTFKQMEMHIKQCRDSEKRLEAFEKVKALSKIQRSPYNYVKTWFMDNYANYSEQPVFDEDGFVVVKTKAEMEAEAKEKAEQEANKVIDMPKVS